MANIDILIEALKNIQSYGSEKGICPYGCDSPNIAKKALVDFGNAEYADSQQAVETDGQKPCRFCINTKEDNFNVYCSFCGRRLPTA